MTNTGTTTLSNVARHGQPGRHGQLPGLHPRPRGVGDLHRDLHGDPGRRRRRIGDQHGHGRRAPTRRLTRSARRRRRSRWRPRNATSSLSLTKSTTSTGYGDAGDTIDYSYLVTNTGTTTLSDIAVSDNLVATVSCPDSLPRPRGVGDLHAGSYTVTQADVDAGSVTNTATASGPNPQDATGHLRAASTVTVDASNATTQHEPA